MREALKTNISKYGPKTNAAMTVENVQGKGLQLVVIYAGRKHYLPLSSVPMNADTHANHPNHQKINVSHNGHTDIPMLGLGNGGEVTISSGAITVTHSFHYVDTEGDGISDDLVTINGSVSTGQLLVLRAMNDARTVVCKDTEGTNKMRLNGDFSLDQDDDVITLIFISPRWYELSRSPN